jgi:hypothetical protein
MVRIKSIFAALMLTVVGVVPQAQAQTFRTLIAGSSGMWQAVRRRRLQRRYQHCLRRRHDFPLDERFQCR